MNKKRNKRRRKELETSAEVKEKMRLSSSALLLLCTVVSYRALLLFFSLLGIAYERVKAVGSATCLVAVKNKEQIHVANLGDSGFVLFRTRFSELYRHRGSEEQQHSFNVPYQLSRLPTKEDVKRLHDTGKTEEGDQLLEKLHDFGLIHQDFAEQADEYTLDM